MARHLRSRLTRLPMMLFRDRAAAGRQLAERLRSYAGRGDVVVLGLPHGGVPVAAEVARALGASLDVFLVRKLGVPGHEELAMGAVASGGVRVLNADVLEQLEIPTHVLDRVTSDELRELERREFALRGDRPPLDLRDKVAIVVDDGLATGSSMRAAAVALRLQQPSRLVLAAPVAAESTCRDLRREADEVVCLFNPDPFVAVGMWYADFHQITEDECRREVAQSAT
jgi:putative phosphoribosyl transferase